MSSGFSVWQQMSASLFRLHDGPSYAWATLCISSVHQWTRGSPHFSCCDCGSAHDSWRPCFRLLGVYVEVGVLGGAVSVFQDPRTVSAAAAPPCFPPTVPRVPVGRRSQQRVLCSVALTVPVLVGVRLNHTTVLCGRTGRAHETFQTAIPYVVI